MLRSTGPWPPSTTSGTSPSYYTKAFDITKIASVDYVIDPFSSWKAVAHAFLTFGFKDGEHVAISIEIRKKKGDSFSPIRGLFKQFEIMYVIADERDVIRLRSNYRKDKVYMYPIKAPQEKIGELFLDMLTRANKLRDQPEFYNTLANSCTTNIMNHANRIYPGSIPLSYRAVLAGYSDRYAFDLGLIDTDLTFEEARAQYMISDRAVESAHDPDFSAKIREAS
jgi:hypothetical protein